MSLIGSVDHYIRGSSFSSYLERLGFLYQLNNVPEERKRSLFITLSGTVVFDELKLLYPGQDLNTISYDEMVNRLKERFDKTEPNMMYRYKFHNRDQGIEESAENYILAIKLLGENCGFGEHKTEAIKDRIILGLRNEELKKKLLMKDGLTLEEVEQVVVRTELANMRARFLGDDAGRVLSVRHRLGGRSTEYRNNGGQRCRPYVRFRDRSRSRSRSGNRKYTFNRHSERNRASNNSFSRKNNDSNPQSRNNHFRLICNWCKKRGHLKKNCWLMRDRKSVNFVEQINDSLETYDFKRLQISDREEDEVYPCMMISAINHVSEPCLVNALVNNVSLRMEIDCGATVTVISKSTYLALFSKLPVSNYQSKLVVVNGEPLNIFGKKIHRW
ncbi:uncharacterized protein LOC128735085 [Sabethes cyaneus]|uniref:uncharacterized protein LOC128735085 n=1 Tax=Sabethes cyaneus TaxID=53552 RepID=UPI00237E7DDD|nr:uncharacterized protein LOC128735085 [Sabethes cyaneus]